MLIYWIFWSVKFYLMLLFFRVALFFTLDYSWIQDEEYKCFEFSGRASVYEAVQQYNHVYMICDNSNYFLYSLLFSGGLLNAYVLII